MMHIEYTLSAFGMMEIKADKTTDNATDLKLILHCNFYFYLNLNWII